MESYFDLYVEPYKNLWNITIVESFKVLINIHSLVIFLASEIESENWKCPILDNLQSKGPKRSKTISLM